jgi:SAM-dependent methyltransferase
LILKLDLGAGAVSPPGFMPVGAAHGSEIFPLPHADCSVDECRASHVLEHFPHAETGAVLREWVRVLKPAGRLRVAVPDFEKVAQNYLGGVEQPTEAYLMGGQVDGRDYHKALFDKRRLKKALSDAGLVLLRPWESEIADCAGLPISLNLEGTKPFVSEMKVSAAMSVPRLGFMDNFFCAVEAFLPCGIRLRRMGGAFWGQALSNCIEKILEEDDPDAIITLDYDTLFTAGNVAQLVQLAMVHPEAHAIAALQSSRHVPMALFTVKGDDGKNQNRVDLASFKADLRAVDTAHFGLTLIRAAKLRALPRPWFHATPDAEGRWHDGKIDEDIGFWERWREAGNTLFLATRCPVGHAELMGRWPGKDLQAIYQPMREFNEKGPPEDMWK